VYDVTNKDSFYALDSWYQQLQNNAESKIVVMLLGNKVDLPNKEVTSEMGAEYARSKDFGFLEVSAKTDVGIKSAFQGLCSNIYQQVNKGFAMQTLSNERAISLHKSAEDAENGAGGEAGTKKKKKNCC